ncbi:MAG: hypothetical protein NTY65_01055 [Planctomycetota bacterium]|nr:hypothetical protein [Planctomycetota bacterium]
MDIRTDAEKIQRAANWRALRGLLRTGGIGSIIFGGVAIYLGLDALSEDGFDLNGILVAIGGFLVLEGIAVIALPRAPGLIAEGLALLLIGLWNFVIAVTNNASWAGILGFYQILWAIQSFRRYPRFRRIGPDVQPEALAWFDATVAALKKADLANDTTVVALTGKQSIWRGEFSEPMYRARLFPDGMFLHKLSGDDTVVAPRSNVVFVPGKPKKLGVSGRLSIGARTMPVTLLGEGLQRLNAWRSSAATGLAPVTPAAGSAHLGREP